jgi:hypothetical protein
MFTDASLSAALLSDPTYCVSFTALTAFVAHPTRSVRGNPLPVAAVLPTVGAVILRREKRAAPGAHHAFPFFFFEPGVPHPMKDRIDT